MVRAFDVYSAQPWLITSEALEQLIAVAQRTNELDIEALAAKSGRRLLGAHTATIREGGVALIPVLGPIFRYANLFAEISGATSTEILAKDVHTALNDPAVNAIVLNIDSPGGMASGINELADVIHEARGVKPIIAYGSGTMASAAYWIGSAADEIVLDRTTIAGSIGARIAFTDARERENRQGVRTIEIVSSQSPDKAVDVATDEGRAKVQKIVDDLAAVFVGTVARNRGVSVETVLSDFGRGGQMVGQHAVDAGLADRLGSLESVIAELSDAPPIIRRSFSMSTQATNRQTTGARGPITIATTAALRAALLAGHTAEEITVESVDVEKIKTEAKAEGLAEAEAKTAAAVDKATTEAVTAERARVTSILSKVQVKGFEKEITAAIQSGATVEATALTITEAIGKRGVSLDQMRSDASNGAAHGGQGADPSVTAGSKQPWSGITSRFNKKRKAG